MIETPDTAAAIVDALERAPRIVVPLVREVPVSVLKRRPAPHRWSAHEQACQYLADSIVQTRPH